MRSAAAGSIAVHGALLAALLFVRPSASIVLPGPDVVQVALLDAPPPEPTPVAEPAPERVEPAAEEGVRLEQKKPKPAKQQPKPPEPPREKPPTEAPRIVLPYAPVAGGLSGQVGVDESNFEFAYYLQQVRTLVGRNFVAPAGSAGGTRTEVHFRIARDGTISELRIATSSGNAVFDQATLRALIVTAKLPPLPLGFSGSSLGIVYGFEYTGP